MFYVKKFVLHLSHSDFNQNNLNSHTKTFSKPKMVSSNMDPEKQRSYELANSMWFIRKWHPSFGEGSGVGNDSHPSTLLVIARGFIIYKIKPYKIKNWQVLYDSSSQPARTHVHKLRMTLCNPIITYPTVSPSHIFIRHYLFEGPICRSIFQIKIKTWNFKGRFVIWQKIIDFHEVCIFPIMRWRK